MAAPILVKSQCILFVKKEPTQEWRTLAFTINKCVKVASIFSCLIFAIKSSAYLSEAHFRCCTFGVGSGCHLLKLGLETLPYLYGLLMRFLK